MAVGPRCADHAAMPLHWTIDSRAHLVTVIADGEICYGHACDLLDTISAVNAHAYRKLIDGRLGRSSITDEELLTLCARIRNIHQCNAVGAIAVVATPPQTVRFARLLGVLATADRPMKIFAKIRQARSWLDRLVLGSPPCLPLAPSSPSPPL
jgi:hypothetical protein